MQTLNRLDTEENYSIRAEGFGAIDQLLLALDADPRSAFAQVDLQLDILDEGNKERRIDYRSFLQLLNHCSEVTGRKDFGSLLGQYQDMTVIGLPGQAMCEAPNFRAALSELIEFFHLHMNGMRVEFQQRGPTCMVALQVVMPFSPDYRQQVELSLGIGLRFIRRLLGKSWQPLEAFFEHQEDSGSSSTQALFRCPINYAHEFNGYTFKTSELDIPREQFNSQAHQILYDFLCLQTRSVRQAFIVEVRHELISGLRAGDCHVDTICKTLGLQRRTFQRRLKREGYLYRELLEQTRMDLAQRYLRSSTIPITDISEILNYTDVTSFSRTFRRFFGTSARRWRQIQDEGHSP